MSRRGILATGVSVVAVAAAIGVGVSIRHAEKPRPKLNVILITLDTTRADHLGCYGYERALTPTLDALARRGVVFEHAFTTAPMTLPAHASIHTGLAPCGHGLFTNGRNRLSDGIPTLADMLSHHGLATGAFVASFVLDRQFGLHRGFQFYDDDMDRQSGDGHGRPQRNADRVVDAALPWLEEHSGQPFFCWLHFYDPHIEYLDHRDSFGDRFKEAPYDGEIAFVDLQLRRLVDWLEARKVADETMIVVVGDHGEGLDEHRERWHGYLLYNSTLEVPLIVSHPSLRAAGTRVAVPVSIVDIGATVLDVLGIPDRDQFGGRSLKAALEGEALSADDCYAATDEGYLEEGWSPLRCLISDRWKYIRTTKPELYDLMSDPHELTNLADAHAETVRELEERLGALEARGFRHEAQPVGLSERERMVLDSLGYLGDPSPRDPADEGDRPDIKDSLEALFAFQGAQALYRTGRREEAMARLQSVIDEYPRYLAPQLMAGRMLESSGQLTRAREVFEEVLKAEADNKEANARVGKLLTTEGRWQEALPYLRRALTADARGNHAIVATSALPLLLQELERNPDSADLHYVVAKMLRALGRHPEAVAHMRAAEMSVRRSAPDRESSN